MAKIICPACNGNEFTRNGDFFVCQYCGTSFSSEAYQKLYVDVKIDKNDEVENLRKLAKMEYDTKKYNESYAHFASLLELKADDWEGQFYYEILRGYINKGIIFADMTKNMGKVFELMKKQITDEDELRSELVKVAEVFANDQSAALGLSQCWREGERGRDFRQYRTQEDYEKAVCARKANVLNMFTDVIDLMAEVFGEGGHNDVIAPAVGVILSAKVKWLNKLMDNTGYSTALKQRLFKRFPGIGNIEKEYNEYNAKYNLNYITYDGLREINEYVLPRKKSYPVHRLLYGIFSLGLGAVLIYCGSGLLRFVLDLMLLEEWKEFTDFSGYINAITSTGNSHWMYQWVLRAVFWAFCLVVAFFVLYKLFNKIGIYLYDMSYPKDINRDLFNGEWYSSIRASKTLQK